MKFTPWFSVSTPPVRSGWYEFHYFKQPRFIRLRWYSIIDKQWRESTHPASELIHTVSNDQWRGVLKEEK